MKYILLLATVFAMCTPAKKQQAAEQPVQDKRSDTLMANRRMIHEAAQLIQSGDLVTRTGNDLTSFYFRRLTLHDNTYSHCGIADVRNGRVYVYHSLGGSFNPSQKLLHEPLERFTSPLENDGFGVFRYRFAPGEQQKVMFTADSLYHENIIFDLDFDLATDNKLYCAEFVYKTLLWGTRGRVKPPTLKTPLKEGVTTDNLFLNPFCTEIKRFVFK